LKIKKRKNNKKRNDFLSCLVVLKNGKTFTSIYLQGG